MTLAVIGGSGLQDIPGLRRKKEVHITTPFGEPSAPYTICSLGDRDIVFLSRHGREHTIPPHRINYRANLWGLKSLGVERIISISAVGSMNSSFRPGAIVLLDQVIDYTGGSRPSTFHDEGTVIHIDLTDPFCGEMRGAILEAGRRCGVPVHTPGTYICVNGPRLETAAEIRFFTQIGADVVGMTAMPEAALARESEICMSLLGVVTNAAAGISERKLTTTEVIETMGRSLDVVRTLLVDSAGLIPTLRTCPCRHALADAGM